MISIDKPKLIDLDDIRELMIFWTEKDEVDKYIERVRHEIMGNVEYHLQFWVAKDGTQTVGIIGLCDPLPKIISFALSDKPGEIKICYLNNNYRGKGIGRQLVDFIENEALAQGYKELLIRSAERYKNSAYGFYEKMGYAKAGKLPGGAKNNPMQVFSKTI